LGSGLGGSSLGGGLGGSSLGGGLGGSSLGGGLGGSSGFGTNTGGLGSSGFGNNTGGLSSNTTARPGTGSTGRTGSQSYGTTSFLGTNYGNPLSLGVYTANGTAAMSFGKPLYTISSTTTTTTGAGGRTLGGAGGLGGTASISGGSQSFTSSGTGVVRRAPAYVATLGFRSTPPPPLQLQADLQGVISRSGQLPSKDGIQVGIEDGVVVLRGAVADDAERRLAEGMLRLTPGVHEVRNDITVRATGP
jgi:hypothetical protein